MLTLFFDAITKAMPLLGKKQAEGETETKEKKSGIGGAILRGLLFTLPLVLFLTMLLTSADAIFEARVHEVIDFIDLENLPDYLWRGFLILMIGYLLAGIYLHAVLKNHDSEVRDQKDTSPILGFIESTVILGSVNLLFLSFVIVQFRYFFGGNANIHIDGYTYAEYARRGFGELVTTALNQLITAAIPLSPFPTMKVKRSIAPFPPWVPPW